MNILALDMSLSATGVCSVAGDLSTLRPESRGDRRLDEIAAIIRDMAAAQRADFIVMEDVPFGHNPAAGPLSLLHGAIRLQLIRKKLPYALVPPASLKKYATGKGNAKKPDMRMELFKRAGKDVADDNQVDAMFLWLMAHDAIGEPKLAMPGHHREAIGKVCWPKIAGLRDAAKEIVRRVAEKFHLPHTLIECKIPM